MQTMTVPRLDYKTLALFGTARETLNRDDVIAAIRAGLKARSGKTWSVTGGRGTAWGWIKIRSPKARCTSEWGYMSDAECRELADLLGFDRTIHMQGENIPASADYRRVYLQRVAGVPVTASAEQYWD